MTNRKIDWASIANALLYVVIGILFIVFKSQMLGWAMTVAGILFIISGIVSLFQGMTFSGIVSIALGAIILLGGWLFVEIVLIVFGVLLAVRGMVALFGAMKPFRLWDVVVAILTVVLGVMMVVSKWVVLDWFYILIGVIFLVNGAIALVGAFRR